MDGPVICNVVSIVAQWRGKERHEPYRADPQFLEVIQLLFKPLKITDSIPIAVLKSADMDLINDCVFVPERILIYRIYRQNLSLWYCHLFFVARGKRQVYTK